MPIEIYGGGEGRSTKNVEPSIKTTTLNTTETLTITPVKSDGTIHATEEHVLQEVNNTVAEAEVQEVIRRHGMVAVDGKISLPEEISEKIQNVGVRYQGIEDAAAELKELHTRISGIHSQLVYQEDPTTKHRFKALVVKGRNWMDKIRNREGVRPEKDVYAELAHGGLSKLEAELTASISKANNFLDELRAEGKQLFEKRIQLEKDLAVLLTSDNSEVAKYLEVLRRKIQINATDLQVNETMQTTYIASTLQLAYSAPEMLESLEQEVTTAAGVKIVANTGDVTHKLQESIAMSKANTLQSLLNSGEIIKKTQQNLAGNSQRQREMDDLKRKLAQQNKELKQITGENRPASLENKG